MGRSSICEQRDKCPTLIQKNRFYPAVKGDQAVHLSHPLHSRPNGLGTQPTYLRVEDSLLKRRPCTYTRKYQPADSFSLYGTIPPPPSPHPPGSTRPTDCRGGVDLQKPRPPGPLNGLNGPQCMALQGRPECTVLYSRDTNKIINCGDARRIALAIRTSGASDARPCAKSWRHQRFSASALGLTHTSDSDGTAHKQSHALSLT